MHERRSRGEAIHCSTITHFDKHDGISDRLHGTSTWYTNLETRPIKHREYLKTNLKVTNCQLEVDLDRRPREKELNIKAIIRPGLGTTKQSEILLLTFLRSFDGQSWHWE